MGKLTDKFREIKREELRQLLEQCSANQIALFNRMYGSIDRIPESKMDGAYEQCTRTLEKNKAEGKVICER